jgi:Lipid A 3-O-deacylase (PagL)
VPRLYRVLFVTAFAIVATGHDVLAFDVDQALAKSTKVVSVEGALAHFGSRLNNGAGYIQAWNLSARFSLIPFGVTRFRPLGGMLDGAVEIGIGPTFERFNTVHQNFAGLGLEVRYYLVRLHHGRFVPWIKASIAPGGTDLRIGTSVSETRLTGPFMNLIQAGVGVSYFVTQRSAVYAGLNAQHISNAGLNASQSNFALNTPVGVVLGMSWYF